MQFYKLCTLKPLLTKFQFKTKISIQRINLCYNKNLLIIILKQSYCLRQTSVTFRSLILKNKKQDKKHFKSIHIINCLFIIFIYSVGIILLLLYILYSKNEVFK